MYYGKVESPVFEELLQKPPIMLTKLNAAFLAKQYRIPLSHYSDAQKFIQDLEVIRNERAGIEQSCIDRVSGELSILKEKKRIMMKISQGFAVAR